MIPRQGQWVVLSGYPFFPWLVVDAYEADKTGKVTCAYRKRNGKVVEELLSVRSLKLVPVRPARITRPPPKDTA